ncbi:hypothetical protein KKA94_04255, partial [Patescibacteria group bacterium]|nr:hypothetical protein [Patescibacteria group bacterium]
MSEREKNYETVSAESRLRTLFEQNRIIPSEYSALISSQETRDNAVRFQRTEYSERWLDLLGTRAETARNFFKHKIAGHPLIDLGGGMGLMRSIASEFGPTEYINVDRQYHKDLPPNPHEIRHSAQLANPDTLEIDIHADMLDFVSRLKEGVASFTLNGIDYSIVDNQKYHEVLAKEIVRATRKHGLIFGIQSIALSQIAEQL